MPAVSPGVGAVFVSLGGGNEANVILADVLVLRQPRAQPGAAARAIAW